MWGLGMGWVWVGGGWEVWGHEVEVGVEVFEGFFSFLLFIYPSLQLHLWYAFFFLPLI